MLWVTVWTLLVLGALGVFARLGYVLFRKGLALGEELGEAADLLARATEQVERLRDTPDPTPAVFADPHELRRQRDRERRARQRGRTMRPTRAGG